MIFFKENKPFIIFGVLVGLFGSLLGICLYLSDLLIDIWNIPLILLGVSFGVLAIVSTLVIVRRFWIVVFVQKQLKIKFLKEQTNYLFFLAIMVAISAILDFASASIYIINAAEDNSLNAINSILTILISVILIFSKIVIIKLSYRNFKLNFKRGLND